MGLGNDNMMAFNFMMNYLRLAEEMKKMNDNQNNSMKFVNGGNQNYTKTNFPKNNSNEAYDPFQGCSGDKINIRFKISTGETFNMLAPSNAKLKDVLVKYVLKMGLGPEVIESSIYFICNGFKIKKQENRTLAQMGYLNGTVILVIDKKGIMGA